MTRAAQMPLQEILQALSRTPPAQVELRAALATTAARWFLREGDGNRAIQYLNEAIEAVPDLRPALRLLFRIYLQRGDVRSAVTYLDQEIRATHHPREAAALYRERGLLVEAYFNDLGAAAQCYQAALKATPRDLAVLRAVERVTLVRGDIFWLIANLETQLEVLEDASSEAALLHALALLEARHHGDLYLAGDLLLASLERCPKHLVLTHDLYRIAETARDPGLMLQALELEAEARSSSQRTTPLSRMSVTFREHRERDAALELMRTSARTQPHNISLWRSLEELAMVTQRHDVALEALVGRLRAIGDQHDPTPRAELYYRTGKLALFRLARINEGLAAMRKALRLAPGHPLVLEDTGRYLTARQRWSQLLELHELQLLHSAEAGMTREEIALCHLRASQVLDERLQDLSGARQHAEQAVKWAPEYRPGRDRLQRLLHQLGDYDALRQSYAEELEGSSDGHRKLFLLSVLSQLHSDAGDDEEAIKALVALLKEQPRHLPSIQMLARLLAATGRTKDVLRVTEQEIKLTTSPGRQAKLLHRVGELALQHADEARAREAFQAAIELVDDHQPSIASLRELLQSQRDYDGLVKLLRKELLYTNDDERRAALRLEVATLLATQLGRKREAMDELFAVLENWPRHLPALHAAESLAAELGDNEALLRLLERHISAVTGPRTRALLLHRTAGLRSKLGDFEGAIFELVRALELWPQLGVARTRLLRMYEHLGRDDRLQTFAEAGLTAERGADDRRAMAAQLAELSDPIAAIQYLGAVTEARPHDVHAQLRFSYACHGAGRFEREAGALDMAIEQLARSAPATDLQLLSLRYRAARAHEAAGNLVAADRGYATMLDAVPTHVLAAAGRTRLKERRRDAALTRNLEELEASAESASTAAARSAYLTMVAELYERRLALPTALAKAEAAVAACATYTPALHVHARVLERMGNPDHLEQAIAVLERIAEIANVNQHKALALCQAGTIALRCGRRNEPNPRAWILFARALELAPVWEPAARGLRRTREAHGTEGAPSLQALLQRHLHALQDDEPTTENLRELIRLGGEIDGPGCVIALCESIAHREQLDVELFVDLAQAQAKCDRWDEAVKTLEAALQRDVTPERRAALLFFAGEANERAKRPAAAIPQYLAAAKAGFYPPHALSAAERLAAASGATDDRVEALRLLIDVVDGTDRAQCLHTLAELYRGPIGQPDVAIEFLRELSLLRPTDVDVLLELHRLFGALGRPQEAISTLTTGLVHLRAWLRSSHPYSTSEAHHESEQLDPQPIMGLMRLFEAIGNRDGMYLAACVLEGFAPQSLGASYSPQELGRALWPLPTPHAGWPIDAMLGDLAAARALSVLAHGIPHLMGSPLPSTEPHEPSTTRELPDTHALVGVIRVLAKTLGMAAPQVIAEPMLDQEVIAHGSLGALLVGKRIVSAPNATSTRDAIGRSLFRLRLGGDALWAQASPEDLARVAAGLASLTGVEVDLGVDVATEFVGRLADLMSGPDIHRGLSTAAKALRDVAPSIRPEQIQLDLFAAEDRAGVLCSGDPRPAIARLRSGPLVRRIALLRFLLSDDHLGMRAALGYLGTAKTPPISPPEVRA